MITIVYSFNFNPYGDRVTFWSVIVGQFFSGLGIGTQQTTVQRYVGLKSLTEAKL